MAGSFRSSVKQIKQNLATAVSSTVLAGLIGLLTLAINTRSLSLEDIGTIAAVQAYVIIIVGVLTLSSHLPLMRMGTSAIEEGRIGELHALVRYALLIDIAVGVVAALTTLLFATVLGAALGVSPTIRAGLLIYAAPVLFFSLSSGNGLLRLVDRFDVLRTAEISGALSLLLAVVVLGLIDAPVRAYFLAYALMYALTQLVRYVLAKIAFTKRHGKAVAQVPLDKSKKRQFLEFATTSSIGSTIDTLRNNGDVVAVSSLFGKEGAGIYGVAKQVSGAVRKFTTFSSLVSFVEFSRMTARGEYAERARLFRHVFKICAAIGAAALLGALLIGRPLLAHAFGEAYAASYWPFVALVAAAGIQFLMYPVSMLVLIDRGGTPSMMCSLVGLIAAGLSLLPLAWAFGLVGVAFASIVYLVVTMAVGVWMIRSGPARPSNVKEPG